MDLKNIYYYFNKEVSKNTCEDIISHGLKHLESIRSSGKSTEGTIITESNTQEVGGKNIFSDKTWQDLKNENPNFNKDNLKHRDSHVAWLSDQWIYDIISPLLYKANNNSGWKFDYDLAEDLQFTVYNPGGYYNWHSDGGSCNLSAANSQTTKIEKHWGKVRKISMTLNLSDPNDYEGGELVIDFGPHSQTERFKTIEESKNQGSVIFFPSFTRHQIRPITKGTRYSLVMWVLGRPFR